MSVLDRVAVVTHRRLSEERPTNILMWKALERHTCALAIRLGAAHWEKTRLKSGTRWRGVSWKERSDSSSLSQHWQERLQLRIMEGATP